MKFGIRVLLLVALLVAVPIGAYYWVFNPANDHVKMQEAQIAEKTKKLAELEEAMTHIRDLDAEVANLKEAVELFEAKLPAEHEIHKVLDQVTKIADRQSLETKLFETQAVKPFAKYWEQPIKMEVSGDFDAYYAFLLSVEKMQRITRIKELELTGQGNDGIITAKFVISIFFDRNIKVG